MLWQCIDYEDLARFFMAGGSYLAAITACDIGLGLQGGNAGLLVWRAQAHDALALFPLAPLTQDFHALKTF